MLTKKNKNQSVNSVKDIVNAADVDVHRHLLYRDYSVSDWKGLL